MLSSPYLSLPSHIASFMLRKCFHKLGYSSGTIKRKRIYEDLELYALQPNQPLGNTHIYNLLNYTKHSVIWLRLGISQCMIQLEGRGSEFWRGINTNWVYFDWSNQFQVGVLQEFCGNKSGCVYMRVWYYWIAMRYEENKHTRKLIMMRGVKKLS